LRKDDLIYVGHMHDLAQEALRLAAGKARADFEVDAAVARPVDPGPADTVTDLTRLTEQDESIEKAAEDYCWGV
jgi:hypothetical protein